MKYEPEHRSFVSSEHYRLRSKGMSGSTRRRRTVIDRNHAISLLYPIAAFFNSGGLNRAQSLAALTAAVDDIRRAQGRRELEYIGAPTCYADVIATWTRERKFLDSRGRPRPLTLSGANGFAALVKTTRVGGDPKQLLNVLIRYRNVRRLGNGRFQLVSPLFRASAGSRMAFEPIASFLKDATSTLTHTLKAVRPPANPDLFWRTVESVQLSHNDAKKFIEFARERSLLFLEELDDWLQAHSNTKPTAVKRRLRVGLGLFSIYSAENRPFRRH